MGRALTLDTILSSVTDHLVKWSSGLESNKAERIARYVIRRLYDQGRGQLVNAQLTLAQTTLSKKLGISRQWLGTLVQRLEREGWIEHHSSKGADGKNESTIWRVGRQLKRLLVMLGKSKRGKHQQNQAAKSSWRFSPTDVVKRLLSIREKEKAPPSPAVQQRIPMLKRWLERGKEKECIF